MDEFVVKDVVVMAESSPIEDMSRCYVVGDGKVDDASPTRTLVSVSVRVLDEEFVVVDELGDSRASAIAGSIMPESMPGIKVACKNDWEVFEGGQDALEKLEVSTSVREWFKIDVDDHNERPLKMKFDCCQV